MKKFREGGKKGIGPSLQPRAPSPRRSIMAKKATHGFAVVKQYFAAAKALFTKAKIFRFCSESLVFVHRLFRNPNE